VKDRVNKYYNADSRVIYPPVNVEKFHISNERGDYFFMVGRLVSYKRFDLAVKVFNKLGYKLKIAGVGPEMNRLRKMANSNIEFLGLVSDEELANKYASCKAIIFPQEEDFGIVPLEAMASGRPVIAFNSGGAQETVIPGKTGVFFNEQSEKSLDEAIRNFEAMKFNPHDCRERAEQFDISKFKNIILAAIK
jgi:glycosyltransferase involved in cell wall biosynthesis